MNIFLYLCALFHLLNAKNYCIENKSGLKLKISVLNFDPYDWWFTEEDTPKWKLDGKFIEPESIYCTILYPNNFANGTGMTLRAITNDGSWITVRVDVQNINGCGYDEVEIGSKGGPTLLNASYCNLTITFEGPDTSPKKSNYVRFCYMPTPFLNQDYQEYGNFYFNCFPKYYKPGLCTHLAVSYSFGISHEWMNGRKDGVISCLETNYRTGKICTQFYDFLLRLFRYRDKHDTNLKILLSIGGPTNDDELRYLYSLYDQKYDQTFYQTHEDYMLRMLDSNRHPELMRHIISLLKQYGQIDGIDVNAYSIWYNKEILKFLTKLREQLDGDEFLSSDGTIGHKLLTATYSTFQSELPNIEHLNNLSKVVDYILITKDNGHFRDAGNQNFVKSPIEYVKKQTLNYIFSGIPSEKLLLGISYSARGYVIEYKNENNILSSNFSRYFRNDWEMAYKDICREVSKGNLKRTFDKKTMTPYALTTKPSEFNDFLDETYWYTFEDTESINEKVNLIKSERLGGAFIWNLAFDDFEGKCDPIGKNFPLTSFIYEQLEGKNASESINDETLLCDKQENESHNEHCSKGWHYFNLTNNCYYVGRYMNGNYARSECERRRTKLVSIANEQEEQFISTLINNARTFGIWIGLVKDASNSNKFKWLDSTQFNYTNWRPNEPNGENIESCVHIDERKEYNNKWNDLFCHETRGSYICERRLPLKTAMNGQNDIGICPAIGYHFSNETLKCHTDCEKFEDNGVCVSKCGEFMKVFNKYCLMECSQNYIAVRNKININLECINEWQCWKNYTGKIEGNVCVTTCNWICWHWLTQSFKYFFQGEAEQTELLIIFIFSFIILIAFLLLIALIFVLIYRKKYRQRKDLMDYEKDTSLIVSYIGIIPLENLIYAKGASAYLGDGYFSVVQAGICKIDNHSIPVAIKDINPDIVKCEETFLNEANVMASLKHENLTKLVGVCVANGIKIITLLRPFGSLNTFLKNNQYGMFVGPYEQMLYCYQISKAMAYLTSQKIVHRDLASRNVLVYKLHHIEVSDFGLARMVDLRDESGQVQVIPTFWAAMECLEKAHTESIYNERTDVWSFGVTCWEILTRTKVLPYEDVWHDQKRIYILNTREKMTGQIEEVSKVLYEALKNGKRLCQPKNCVETLWTTILSCWSENSKSRPSFSELVVKFENYLNEPKAYIKDNRKMAKDQLVFDFKHLNQDRLREILESTEEYVFENSNERSKLADRIDITT